MHASIINMWSRHTKWLRQNNIAQFHVFKDSTHPAHPPEQGSAWSHDAGLMPSHLVPRKTCSLPPWYHHWLPDVWILDQQAWAGRMKLGHGTPGITVKLTRSVDIWQDSWYTQSNKNSSAWNFLSPELQVTWRTVAIIIWVVFLSAYLRIQGSSLSPIHYNQSHRIYINQKQQYICLISN